MQDSPEQRYAASQRRRPSRRVPPSNSGAAATVLSEEMTGIAVAYANTLLFIGYEVNGLVEITIYPRYRFSSDDRVQGHLGYVRVPYGSGWEEILAQVDAVYEAAQNNYRAAVTLRAGELRAHGASYEAAYEAITDIFRESWHGFALRLRREGQVTKGDVTVEGKPPGPVLAAFAGEPYTLQVFPTGSILLLKGDQRKRLRELSRV